MGERTLTIQAVLCVCEHELKNNNGSGSIKPNCKCKKDREEKIVIGSSKCLNLVLISLTNDCFFLILVDWNLVLIENSPGAVYHPISFQGVPYSPCSYGRVCTCVSSWRKQDTAAQSYCLLERPSAILNLQTVEWNWWCIATWRVIAFMGAIPLCVCPEVTRSIVRAMWRKVMPWLCLHSRG